MYGIMAGYVKFIRETLLDYYKRIMEGERISGINLTREQLHLTSKGFLLKQEVWLDIALTVDRVIRLL